MAEVSLHELNSETNWNAYTGVSGKQVYVGLRGTRV
jgi:hypothetical protein